MQFAVKISDREVLAAGVLVLGSDDHEVSFMLDGMEFVISLIPTSEPLTVNFIRKAVKHMRVELSGQFPMFSASWKLSALAQAGERQIDLDLMVYSLSDRPDATRQVSFSFTAHPASTTPARPQPDLLRFM